MDPMSTVPPLPLDIVVLLGSMPAEGPSPLHELLRAARAGRPAARRTILERLGSTPAPTTVRNALVVPVPGHAAGPPDAWLTLLATTVARAWGWRCEPKALVRGVSIAEAKRGGSRDPANEGGTLLWTPPGGDDPIVLFDDVVRTGTTLEACAMRVRSADAGRTILGVALAKVELSPANDGFD
jgi:predicted amidophosphoribosyltransferase